MIGEDKKSQHHQLKAKRLAQEPDQKEELNKSKSRHWAAQKNYDQLDLFDE